MKKLLSFIFIIFILIGCGDRGVRKSVGEYKFEFTPETIVLRYTIIPDGHNSTLDSNVVASIGKENIVLGMAIGLSLGIPIFTYDMAAHQFETTKYYLIWKNGDFIREFEIQSGSNQIDLSVSDIDYINRGYVLYLIGSGRMSGSQKITLSIVDKNLVILDRK